MHYSYAMQMQNFVLPCSRKFIKHISICRLLQEKNKYINNIKREIV